MRDDLPLFSWSPPPCRVLPFPLDRRVGRVREVASKLLNKATDKHASYYRAQVDEALRQHLSHSCLASEQQERQLALFWSSVRNEMNRLVYHYGGCEGEAS